MGKIIAFSGSHGTGKTTAVFEYAAKLKKTTRSEVGIITEVARRCPLPVLGSDSCVPSSEAQIWIFAEQIRCEIEASLRYDITVSDRTAADSIAYSLLSGFTDLAGAQVALARHHMRIYKEIKFQRIDPDWPRLVDDGFRSVDHELQIEVERLLLGVYRELGVVVGGL